MVKTLRIASYSLAAGAVCGVVALAVIGLKGNPEIQSFLDQKGVIEKLKGQAQTAPQKDDNASPLVTQAKAFALRIDPPPPPPPPPPPVGTKPETVKNDPKQPLTPPPPPPPPPPTVRYDLIATARYSDQPERSLALLKPIVGPAKWYRQGDKLGHFDIFEIRDGSVVLYQNGKLNTEIFVPLPKTGVKSLLKSDAVAAAHIGGSTGVTVSAQTNASADAAPTDTAALTAEAGTPGALRVTRTPPTRTVDASSRIQRVVAPVREQTAAEKKESIQQSISNIEGIISRTDETVSAEERQQEQEAWMQLLKLLQEEKTNLEQETPAAGTEKKPAAEQGKDPGQPSVPEDPNNQ